ncbi:MAG: 50S ribosomal protein L18 [Candidatus Omnitrophica bacterium]|nr:50S ribosomal protein L18 [Candidatus Omnitrophota bacterium]
MKNKKEQLRIKRHKRLRLRIHGTSQRPRLSIHRSLRHLQAQLIDDDNARTLFSLSTCNKKIMQGFKDAGNVKAAQYFGEQFALLAKEKGFSKVVFDRAGYLYHGRIKAFAEGARKGGLIF